MLIFILIVFTFIFVFIYLYNISYLPLFIPTEIVRQGEGIGDISNFIRIRDEIINYEYDINVLNTNISNIRRDIINLENNIEIQQRTINTLRDELINIENALENQINLDINIINLNQIINSLNIFILSSNHVKTYIYINVKDFIYKFIFLSQILNVTNNLQLNKKIINDLNNIFIFNTIISAIKNYIYNKIYDDINKIILTSSLLNSII